MINLSAGPGAPFASPFGGTAAPPPPSAPAPALDEQDQFITEFFKTFPRDGDGGPFLEARNSSRRPLTQLASLLDTYRKAGDKGVDKLHGYALRRILLNFREEGAVKPPSKLLSDGEWEDALECKETYGASPELALPPPFTPMASISIPVAPFPVEGFDGLLKRAEMNSNSVGISHKKVQDCIGKVNVVLARACREHRMINEHTFKKFGITESFDERMARIRDNQRVLLTRMLHVCQRIDMAYAKRLRLHESAEELELREEIQRLFASLNHHENLEMRVQKVRVQLHEQIQRLSVQMASRAQHHHHHHHQPLPAEVLSTVDELQAGVNERLRTLQDYNKDIVAAKVTLSRLRGCCGARLGGWD